MLFIQLHERLQLLGTLIKLVWSTWGWYWEISTIICAYFGKYGQTICEKLFNKQTHSKRTYKRVSIYYVSKTIRQHFFNSPTYRTGSPMTRGFPEAEGWVHLPQHRGVWHGEHHLGRHWPGVAVLEGTALLVSLKAFHTDNRRDSDAIASLPP